MTPAPPPAPLPAPLCAASKVESINSVNNVEWGNILDYIPGVNLLPSAVLFRSAKDSERPTLSRDSMEASKRIICISLFMSF